MTTTVLKKPPNTIHEHTKSKQERNEQLIVDKQGAHEVIGIGNNRDREDELFHDFRHALFCC
jgi:hypothetical protein